MKRSNCPNLCAVIKHDIESDIPYDHQAFCRFTYIAWYFIVPVHYLLNVMTSFAVAAILNQFNYFGFSIVDILIIIPTSFFVVHILYTIYKLIGLNLSYTYATGYDTGLVLLFEAYQKNQYTIGGICVFMASVRAITLIVLLIVLLRLTKKFRNPLKIDESVTIVTADGVRTFDKEPSLSTTRPTMTNVPPPLHIRERP
ncbi:hypothetical protein BC833DRAFT_566065 [Globomyces pollinis-pini]|nr:hypothetical protein BC833DRAFT_566065 [Globomyces pollinis-pini]KAJ2991844.1 hypothetical protein HDV02_003467 [Globomyces sp. JEL0801]